MKLEVNENADLTLREVYNPIVLITDSHEKMYICMRDSGFEFTYEGKKYEAKEGHIREVGPLDKTGE